MLSRSPLGRIQTTLQEERAEPTHQPRWSRHLLRLATPFRLHHLGAQPPPRVFRLWKNESWRSNVLSNTERNKPSLRLSGEDGMNFSPLLGSSTNTPTSQTPCDTASMQVLNPYLPLSPHPTTIPYERSQMSSRESLNMNSSATGTSALSQGPKQKNFWDLFRLPLSQSYPNPTAQTNTVSYKTSPS